MKEKSRDFTTEIFISRVRQAVGTQKMKLGKLERDAGVSVGYISRVEKGRYKPGIDVVVNMAKVLGVSVDFLSGADIDRKGIGETNEMRLQTSGGETMADILTEYCKRWNTSVSEDFIRQDIIRWMHDKPKKVEEK
jgi:transcriptional regulator with XRE-family HTH domain